MSDKILSIVSLSGGMDSATLLAHVLSQDREVLAVGFDYGSKHGLWERQKAIELCSHYNVPYRQLDLCSLMKGFRSNLLRDGGAIPEGHYEEESMKLTVVPARNIIFSSVLAGIAWNEGASEIYVGIHAGDHAIYPDCRPDFFLGMKTAIWHGTDSRACLFAPFLFMTKAEILRQGLALKVPYQHTRTCYVDDAIACGKCGSCCERREAFMLNNAEDPIPYKYTGPLPEKAK